METGSVDIEAAYRSIVDEGIDPLTGASFESITLQRREHLLDNMAKVISRRPYATESDAIAAIREKIDESVELAKPPNDWDAPYNPDTSVMLTAILDTGSYKTSEHYRPNFVQ